jgi:hypothetical protein
MTGKIIKRFDHDMLIQPVSVFIHNNLMSLP